MKLLLFRESESMRQVEYQAAVRIQAWYRGICCRMYLR